MKKFLLSFTIVAAFAACNNKPAEPSLTNVETLTPGKQNYDLHTVLSDTGSMNRVTVYGEKEYTAPATTRIIERVVYRDRPVRSAPKKAPQKEIVYVPAPASGTDNNNTGGNSNTNNNDGGTVAPADVPVPVPEKKKGWNNATKGAVIGGVGGAIGGAIISKKKGKGAIIGGVVGAAGGYVLGKVLDNKKARDNAQYTQFGY